MTPVRTFIIKGDGKTGQLLEEQVELRDFLKDSVKHHKW